MGVHGLRQYMSWHRKSCLQSTTLHDCRVLVDGSNLAYLLYTKAPGITSAFGGDYDKYGAHVAFFFARLQQCGVEAVVLMDGGQPQDNIKFHTCSTRLQSTINSCLYYTPGYSTARVFPLHARAVFVSVLKRMGIMVLQCDFEADQDLAFLARKFNAKVLSNDSDFFLYDVEYVLLDTLLYRRVKRVAPSSGGDGAVKCAIPCQVFRREVFLQLCGLHPRQLGLLAALCGNDCVPPPLLKDFHQYLMGGRKKKFGHTKRQNLLLMVTAFIAKNRRCSNQEIINMVVQRVSSSEVRGQLQKTLQLVTASYSPRDCSLEYWLQQRFCGQGEQLVQGGGGELQEKRGDKEAEGHEHSSLQKQQKQEENEAERQEKEAVRQEKVGERQKKEEEQDNDEASEQERQGEQQQEKEGEQLENHSHQQSQKEMSSSKQNDEKLSSSNLTIATADNCAPSICSCEKLWRGLIDDTLDEVLIKNAGSSIDGHDDDGDEGVDHVGGGVADMLESDDDDGEVDSPDDGGYCNDNEMVDVDSENPSVVVDINATGKENYVATNTSNTAAPKTDVVDDALPKDLQNMSKKQRKKELERRKHQERMKKNYAKKAEALELKKIQSEKSENKVSFDITGLDASQVIRMMEMQEQGLLNSQGVYIGNPDQEKIRLQDEEYCDISDSGDCIRNENAEVRLPHSLGQCPHAYSNLVTKSGFRLPDWLVYGYRHNIVGREISDIVTNNFCISPPQMECLEQASCYRVVERVVKILVVLLKGGGSDVVNSELLEQFNLPLGEEQDEQLEKKNRECSTEKSAVQNQQQQQKLNSKGSSARNNSNSALNKRKRRKRNKNDLRWFIRESKDLSIEDICLEEIFSQHSRIPSLTCIEKLESQHRKLVFLNLLFNKEDGTQLLQLPNEFQLQMSFMCYWYRNTLSDVNESHLMALLVTLFMFYIVHGKVGPQTSDCLQVCCAHCVVKASKEYKAEQQIKSLTDRMICNRDSFNYKNKYKSRRTVRKLLNNRGLKTVVEGNSSINGNDMTVSADLMMSSCEENQSGNLSFRIEEVMSSISREESADVRDRISSFHNPVDIDNSNYDREFVHSMSEYQACVHYLNILNGLLLTPFPAVNMEKIWSGTFCYNIYRTLLQYEERSVHLVALLLGVNSSLYRLFVVLFKFLNKTLNLEVDIPDLMRVDQKTIIEEFVGVPCKKKKANIEKKKSQS